MSSILNQNELKTAKECVYNIQDKINAINTELNYKDNAFKGYILEKLSSILHDTECLIGICSEEEEVENIMEEYEVKKTGICSICGCEYDNYGNNAQPINNGRCCNECNDTRVIPERIKRLQNGEGW